jgi:hypothetical protein
MSNDPEDGPPGTELFEQVETLSKRMLAIGLIVPYRHDSETLQDYRDRLFQQY